jgi:hypothetical protein
VKDDDSEIIFYGSYTSSGHGMRPAHRAIDSIGTIAHTQASGTHSP